MDPNVALAEMRESIKAYFLTDDDERAAAEAQVVVERANALDEWLSKDGFLPSDWAAEEDKPSACVEAGKHLKTETHGWYSCPAVTRVGS